MSSEPRLTMSELDDLLSDVTNGRVIVLSETHGGELSCISYYRDGKEAAIGVICNTLHEALDCLRDGLPKGMRARKRKQP